MADALIDVTLCWSPDSRQVQELHLQVPQGSTVQNVVERARAEILKFLQPGIWGRKVVWSQTVAAGDRIELYRPLKVDPKVARRQRFKRQGKGRTGLFANRKSGVAAGY
jgi:putative ubiquitin-RnfH superfamily antitoxin RatB of RatAB toxin-antitoxin module